MAHHAPGGGAEESRQRVGSRLALNRVRHRAGRSYAPKHRDVRKNAFVDVRGASQRDYRPPAS